MKNLYDMYFDLHKKGIVIKISFFIYMMIDQDRVNSIISNDQYEMSADSHHLHYLNRPMTITKEQPCKLKSTIDGQIILPDNC